MVERFRPSFWVRFCKILFVACALMVSVDWMYRAIPGYLPRDWSAAHEFDSLADWKGARLALLGKSPYTKEGLAMMGQDGMGHPPTAPFWYLPLAGFEKSVAALLSSVLLLLFLPLHVYLCVRELRYPAPLALALLVCAAIANTAWLRYHYEVIQYSEPIAFLYVLSWLGLRSGRDVAAGAALGAALTLKLFPGLLLIFLLLARRFRALLAAVGVYVAVALVMTRFYGLDSWFEFFRQQRKISDDWLGVLQNSSLPGLVVRVLKPACEGQGHPTFRTTVVSIALSLLLVALAAWRSWARFAEARERDPRAIDVPFALFALLSGFLNAWAWEHYFVLTVQPLLVLFATFAATWWSAFRRWAVEDCSTRHAFGVSLISLLGTLGVALTCRALAVDFKERDALLGLWFRYKEPFYHHLMHWFEAANYASWIVPILLCFLALSLRRKASSPVAGGEHEAEQQGGLGILGP